MPVRNIRFESGNFYHVYNRGFTKQKLFFEEKDFIRFSNTIEKYKAIVREKYNWKKFPIKILAYAFMPNHFHFLIEFEEFETLSGAFNEKSEQFSGTVTVESGIVSEFFGRIQMSYAQYFNNKYGEKVKKGLKMPVFEGRFQAKLITDEAYLYVVKTYIDYNPVHHNLVKKPEYWEFCSFNSKYYDGITVDIENADEIEF